MVVVLRVGCFMWWVLFLVDPFFYVFWFYLIMSYFRVKKNVLCISNILFIMCNMSDIPARYMLPNGKYESLNSYNTFVNYYLEVEPTPTAKELATLTGFSFNTCRTWITKNNFKARKSEFLEQQKKIENLSIKEVNESILSLLAGIKLNNTMIYKNTIDDLVNRQKELFNMDTLDPERLELIKENSSLMRDFNNLINGLRAIDEYDDYLKEDSYSIEDMQLLLEKWEDIRESQELEALEQLQKDLEDEPF